MQVFLQIVAFSLQLDGSGRPVLPKGKRPKTLRPGRTQTGMNLYWYEIFAAVYMNREETLGAWFRDEMISFV